MLYERLRREEVLRDLKAHGERQRSEERASVAAGAGEIDRADKRDCYQQKYGSEEGVNDHHNAPELPLSDACGTPAVHYLFSMGYRSHYVQRSRQERTCAGIARSNRVLERGRQIFSAYYAGP